MRDFRTWSIAVIAIAALVACAWPGSVKGEDLQAVKWGLVGIVGLVAGRSVGRAAAGGGGLKGIAEALVTPAKPEGGS